ncbi:1-phosphofructokinase family hexose kinase, partial [Blautia hydrogenotrophica]
GGCNGQFIQRELKRQGIPCEFCEITAESRNNISIIHGKHCTEILERGEKVQKEELQRFCKQYERLLDDAGTVVLSGSLPQGATSDFYAGLVQTALQKNRKVILDTSGDCLRESLHSVYKPFLIKPNEKELEELTGQKLYFQDEAAIKNVLSSELFQGIECVVVSLGASGAVVKQRDTFYRVSVPQIDAVNPIGSGDSVIAGMALSFDHGEAVEDAIKRGMAFGVLNALEAAPGKLKLECYEDVISKVEVERF